MGFPHIISFPCFRTAILMIAVKSHLNTAIFALLELDTMDLVATGHLSATALLRKSNLCMCLSCM